jgi:hypothetical protein
LYFPAGQKSRIVSNNRTIWFELSDSIQPQNGHLNLGLEGASVMDDRYSKEYEFYEHEAIGAKYPIPKS